MNQDGTAAAVQEIVRTRRRIEEIRRRAEREPFSLSRSADSPVRVPSAPLPPGPVVPARTAGGPTGGRRS